MTLAFIGIGNVGFALANNFQKKGHHIIVAHNNPNSTSVTEAIAKNTAFSTQLIQEAIDRADVILLATPFFANEAILKPLDFKGKTLVDCTNPVGQGISHGLESKISGSEQIEAWATNANVVKSFTIYGFENFINAEFPNYNTKPVMLIAGNNTSAKETVAQLISDLGYITKDTGSLDQALHLEHMTLLWVKMARRDGHHPNFTWAYLEK
ncbi:NADPH-dependent F420 reductase [Psychroserpens sp. S379A]|uniref:NADPH-dependent F420 reductase n=1 Tax=Psychroserpens sp. S379A TaxID=3415137 RepID=UPI003C7A5F97